ncbi:hypothetical protein MSLAZ_1533 [Methanosarcina lacustris Z-7289]|uniref:Uncharacterized protein n=1 Tax=Methanosarcina lacustris Z-7289 TaxID=1434111 RepID=A0A0E3S239_9EURY|nr:hypothetical protein [Methanosarcina lacustris]AKB74794.1 hypothetical protein MSLAZ_1533 [Methanosarcina lacustris Z-7289]
MDGKLEFPDLFAGTKNKSKYVKMKKNRDRNIPGTNIRGSDLSPRIGGTSGGHFRTSSAGNSSRKNSPR